MIRSWGIVPITGAAQPWFGDVLTAAMPVKLPPNGIVIVTVESTVKYQNTDRITLDPFTVNTDTLFVERVLSATQLQCSLQGDGQIHPHNVGAVITLAIPAAQIVIQPTNTAKNPLYLGADNGITNVPAGNIYKMILPQSSAGADTTISWNTMRTDDGWMVGTAGDSAIVSMMIA